LGRRSSVRFSLDPVLRAASSALARAAAILNEVIDAIARGFDEQTEPTEAMPQEEAASVRRLAASILLSEGDKRSDRPRS